MFTKAKMEGIKVRMALSGPTGSGKTFSALNIASHLGTKIAVIDSESGSASKYADRFSFDVLVLDSFEPQKYVQALQAAANGGYDVLIVDSLSHAWNGTGGLLEQVDNICHRMKTNNSMLAWKEATPIQNDFIQALLKFPGHLIATLRVKTDYQIDKDDRGKAIVRKLGLAPIQRDGVEYEFDIVGELNQDNILVISKSRCPELQGSVIRKPGKELADKLRSWMKEKPAVESAVEAPTGTSVVKPTTEQPTPAKNTPSPRKSATEAKKAKPPLESQKHPDLLLLQDFAAKLKLNGDLAHELQTLSGETVTTADQLSTEGRKKVIAAFQKRLLPPTIGNQRIAKIREVFNLSAQLGQTPDEMKQAIGKLLGLDRPIQGSAEIKDDRIDDVLAAFRLEVDALPPSQEAVS